MDRRHTLGLTRREWNPTVDSNGRCGSAPETRLFQLKEVSPLAREYKIISADSHVNPVPTMYAERLPARFRDRAPRLEQRGSSQVMVFEGQDKRFTLLTSAAGKKFEDYEFVGENFEDGRKGGWDPHARIEDMEIDGVDAEVLYGSALGGGSELRAEDPEFHYALMQAYNDWTADFCRAYPDRLVGIADIPFRDLDLAIAEAKRARDNGMRGVLVPAIPAFDGDPPENKPYTDPWYEPLWSALEDLQMPIHFHLGARPLTRGMREQQLIAALSCDKSMMSEPITSFIFSGALDRHPGLRIVSVEGEVGWMAFLVPWMDNMYERHRHWTGAHLPELPSFYFQRQVRGSFINDALGVRERHTIGLDCIMWSSDYPHSDSIWPHSQEWITENLAGVPADERHKIVCGNAVDLYGLA